jgi:hypothetical protein
MEVGGGAGAPGDLASRLGPAQRVALRAAQGMVSRLGAEGVCQEVLRRSREKALVSGRSSWLLPAPLAYPRQDKTAARLPVEEEEGCLCA